MKTLTHLIAPLLIIFTLVGCTSLRDKPVYNHQGYAVSGYDVVAYFTENKAIKGNAEFQTQYQGSTWLFASQQHLTQFEQSPLDYMPQYGGYCAYAMSSGFVVSIDPQAFTVFENKLYLNYSMSVRDNWTKHKSQYIQSADYHWANKNQ